MTTLTILLFDLPSRVMSSPSCANFVRDVTPECIGHSVFIVFRQTRVSIVFEPIFHSGCSTLPVLLSAKNIQTDLAKLVDYN